MERGTDEKRVWEGRNLSARSRSPGKTPADLQPVLRNELPLASRDRKVLTPVTAPFLCSLPPRAGLTWLAFGSVRFAGAVNASCRSRCGQEAGESAPDLCVCLRTGWREQGGRAGGKKERVAEGLGEGQPHGRGPAEQRLLDLVEQLTLPRVETRQGAVEVVLEPGSPACMYRPPGPPSFLVPSGCSPAASTDTLAQGHALDCPLGRGPKWALPLLLGMASA